MFSSVVVGTDGSATAAAAVGEAINLAAKLGARLLIVGNKGMTGAKRFMLGSGPNKISHHAPCSVLIVRTT